MPRAACLLAAICALGACGRAASRDAGDAERDAAGGASSEAAHGAPGLNEPIAAEPTRREPSPDPGQSEFSCRRARDPSAEHVHACVLLSACVPDWFSYGGSSV